MDSDQTIVTVAQQGPEAAALRSEIIATLTAPAPSIPAKLHYDERGSELFEEICEQPEYYLTRSEIAILEAHGESIGRAVGPGAAVVEPGSGASIKTELLMRSLPECAAYVPSDISEVMLEEAAQRVSDRFPELPVIAVHADFVAGIDLPSEAQLGRRRLVYFPGSTIGNFDPDMQQAVLRGFAKLAGDDGACLIGYDRVKDISRLEAAYNDAAGVTAEFNLNMVDRLATEFDFGVSRDDFEFVAEWDEDRSAVVSHVVALRDVTIGYEGGEVRVPRGSRIRTEESHKYTPARFASLAESVGLRVDHTWCDANEDFAVALLSSA